ncbi:unnamed protein product [Protopolystoma xenopodis]|uniref:Uncharacterized protein n=1 Tax=Protopolystoma xenopodis TaxID=117903 RepID=A0A448WEG5_9PLAT|nr:unnamed protein product [Protopolystoma xenopodis]
MNETITGIRESFSFSSESVKVCLIPSYVSISAYTARFNNYLQGHLDAVGRKDLTSAERLLFLYSEACQARYAPGKSYYMPFSAPTLACLTLASGLPARVVEPGPWDDLALSRSTHTTPSALWTHIALTSAAMHHSFGHRYF